MPAESPQSERAADAKSNLVTKNTFLEFRNADREPPPALATFPMMMPSSLHLDEDENSDSGPVEESAEDYNDRLAKEIAALEGVISSEDGGVEVVVGGAVGKLVVNKTFLEYRSTESLGMDTPLNTSPMTASVDRELSPGPDTATGSEVMPVPGCTLADRLAESRTTVMVKNLPCDLTGQSWVELLDKEGFQGEYDLIYLPMDFRSGFSMGYGFANFGCSISAERFVKTFDGYSNWEKPSKKVARVLWSEQQGLEANVEKYRNSSVMHRDVPESFKPLRFEDGRPVALPPPTRDLLPPPRDADLKQRMAGATPLLPPAPVLVSAAARSDPLPPTSFTTVMLRNIPNDYTRSHLLQVFNLHGLFGLYDFVYLPMDFERQCSLGYAFVNWVSHPAAVHFSVYFSGFKDWGLGFPTRKVATVEWAKPRCQGLEAHINRYRGRPIMQSTVPDECKPALFLNGMRVAFPQGARTSGRSQASD